MVRRDIGNFRPKGPSITIRYEERKKKSLVSTSGKTKILMVAHLQFNTRAFFSYYLLFSLSECGSSYSCGQGILIKSPIAVRILNAESRSALKSEKINLCDRAIRCHHHMRSRWNLHFDASEVNLPAAISKSFSISPRSFFGFRIPNSHSIKSDFFFSESKTEALFHTSNHGLN